MKKIAIAACAAVLAMALAGCGGSTSSSAAASSSASSSVSASSSAAAFDGSGFSDTGAGTMHLATAGGTSENGNVPEIAGGTNTMMQIELDTNGMDGSVCTVYVDGVELTTMNAGERTQQALTLQGDALAKGEHVVELVKMDGDKPAIYKKAQYKVV